MEDFAHVSEVLPYISMGDRIEFQDAGYSHWALFIEVDKDGVPWIIHLYRWDDQDSEYKIQYDRLYEVANGRKIRYDNPPELQRLFNNINKPVRRKRTRADVIKYAEKKRKEGVEYSVLGYNCEHFVNECIYGNAYSEQMLNLPNPIKLVINASAGGSQSQSSKGGSSNNSSQHSSSSGGGRGKSKKAATDEYSKRFSWYVMINALREE